MEIKVLGSGCSNCKKTFEAVKKYVENNNIKANVIKDEDITSLLKYGAMSTPAVVINEKVVHSGGIPNENDIKAWF